MGDHLRILLGVVVHSFLLLLHVAQDDEIFLAVLHLCLCVRAIIPLCVCVRSSASSGMDPRCSGREHRITPPSSSGNFPKEVISGYRLALSRTLTPYTPYHPFRLYILSPPYHRSSTSLHITIATRIKPSSYTRDTLTDHSSCAQALSSLCSRSL